MNDEPLHWPELKSVALWAIEGPRALVSERNPEGGEAGWVERLMHWQKHLPSGGITESRTIFRRPDYGFTTLPAFVVRAATWNNKRDREASREQGVQQISLHVEHFEFDESLLAQITARQPEISASVAAIVDELGGGVGNPPPGETVVYGWGIPGTWIGQTLDWISSKRTSRLEQLWKETLPAINPPQLHGFFERFEVDTFGNFLDVALDEIPTVHRLL